jgi:hypothetical protein
MGGGLLQLVAYGAQDVYLTGNPQITFFKVVYRRHTNFAMEAIQQTFNGTPGYGQTVYCQVSRNGDLIHRTYLQVNIPAISSYNFADFTTGRYVNYLGLRLLKTVTIEIGGQQIDKHYSDWLYIWNELSLPFGKKWGWNMMVGADSDVVSSQNLLSPSSIVNGSKKTLYIPLEFWFCRNIGLALPLIALQYHEVKFKIEFETQDNCMYQLSAANPNNAGITVVPATTAKTQVGSSLDATLWVDYIFLDTDERRRFAQLSHEYLIEQLQFTGQETLAVGANRLKLNFNHPVKELIWVAKYPTTYVPHWYNYTEVTNFAAAGAYSPFKLPYDPTSSSSIQFGARDVTNNANIAAELFNINMTGASTLTSTPLTDTVLDDYKNKIMMNITPNKANPFTDGLLQLNGNDRFNKREGKYFNYVQPYQHHTNIPNNSGINVYSFSLKPEEHQPSGSLNMSRIDTAVLSVTSTVSGGINIYAVNYNVLRILSGMGGLAYSN